MTVMVILPLFTKSRLVLSQRLCQGNMYERNLTREVKIKMCDALYPKVKEEEPPQMRGQREVAVDAGISLRTWILCCYEAVSNTMISPSNILSSKR
jgi:hypothetical protein